MPIQIVFADDSDTVRNLIKGLLIEANPGWEICEAKTGKAAVQMINAIKPHLALLDMNLPDIQGSEVARQIRKSLPDVKIVLCSLGDFNDVAGEVKACGADAYVSKLSPIDELYKTLASIIRGDTNPT
jgi:DNA-binding NarL/FixJ family response regulator